MRYSKISVARPVQASLQIQVRGFLMLKSMLRAAASAADDDDKLVESLPPEVADVVTGGS
jgi:hypothetical protein